MKLGQSHPRSVRLFTTFGQFDGTVISSGMLRLLDDMNIVSRSFLMLHEPVCLSGRWSRGEGPMMVNKSSILFVQEHTGATPATCSRRISGQFTRSAVEFLLPEHTLHGHVHVPPDGDPMTRLNNREQGFIALTSVFVLGSERQESVPFVAVNRSHILAARRLDAQSAIELADDQDLELAIPLDDPEAI